MRVLFIEPPKDFWFIMGEYRPPPFGLLCLAAYLEAHLDNVEISVVDCQAEKLQWDGLENRITEFKPEMVCPGALTTANTYRVARTTQLAKKVNPEIITVVGGIHFSTLSDETLVTYPEIDFVVRGEGEQTLLELVQALEGKNPLTQVNGLTYRHARKIVHTPDRAPIMDLDTLPYPGYHFVRDHMKDYHFLMMAGKNNPYALIEASRGCDHKCTFCTQWRYWGRCRRKSPKRVADEFEYVYKEFGSRFLWLTDDNLALGDWMDQFCDELLQRDFQDDLLWFMQVRADDIIKDQHLLPKMRKTGLHWAMAGVETYNPTTLEQYRKGLEPGMAKEAMKLLKENGIMSQTTAIIGERSDSHESIEAFRQWIDEVDPDIAIFMILTPYPGTEIYKTAKRNGWIEDENWAHYDMVHAIMPTEHLSRGEVQHELYQCYRNFFGSWSRRISGLFSSNKVKRTCYSYMMRRGVVQALKEMALMFKP
ncbi:MAG: B12-binding domain-containing radical SAM protein [Candidatus Hermodarchaeia archaeon]|jgi:anaerobic magnesium-protoporphyrin IX monomethyl ester cyclase